MISYEIKNKIQIGESFGPSLEQFEEEFETAWFRPPKLENSTKPKPIY